MDKDIYRRICETEGLRIPLFQQYWWMETVCAGKRWEVLLVREGDCVRGAWPYLCGSRMGLRYVLLPQLTMFGGPWLADSADSEALDCLVQQFAKLNPALCLQRLAPSVTSAKPFTLLNCKVSRRSTYRFDLQRGVPELMAAASELRRRDYKRLDAQLHIDTDIDATLFADMHADYWRRRGKRDLVGRDLIVRVCTEAVGRGQGILAGARDGDGRLHAALFAPYDQESAYLLLSAIGPEAPRNVMSYLIWKVLALLQDRTRWFDFEGGAEEGVGRYYRSFGAEKVEYLQLMRAVNPLLAKLLK